MTIIDLMVKKSSHYLQVDVIMGKEGLVFFNRHLRYGLQEETFITEEIMM